MSVGTFISAQFACMRRRILGGLSKRLADDTESWPATPLHARYSSPKYWTYRTQRARPERLYTAHLIITSASLKAVRSGLNSMKS